MKVFIVWGIYWQESSDLLKVFAAREPAEAYTAWAKAPERYDEFGYDDYSVDEQTVETTFQVLSDDK